MLILRSLLLSAILDTHRSFGKRPPAYLSHAGHHHRPKHDHYRDPVDYEYNQEAERTAYYDHVPRGIHQSHSGGKAIYHTGNNWRLQYDRHDDVDTFDEHRLLNYHNLDQRDDHTHGLHHNIHMNDYAHDVEVEKALGRQGPHDWAHNGRNAHARKLQAAHAIDCPLNVIQNVKSATLACRKMTAGLYLHTGIVEGQPWVGVTCSKETRDGKDQWCAAGAGNGMSRKGKKSIIGMRAQNSRRDKKMFTVTSPPYPNLKRERSPDIITNEKGNRQTIIIRVNLKKSKNKIVIASGSTKGGDLRRHTFRKVLVFPD